MEQPKEQFEEEQDEQSEEQVATQTEEEVQKQPNEPSIGFSFLIPILIFILFLMVARAILVRFRFSRFDFNPAVFMTIDGIVRGVFAILCIHIFSRVIQYEGVKFTFSTQGFAKGMFAHMIGIILIIAFPLIVLTIPEAQLSFRNVAPLLAPMLVFDVANAVWEEVLWRGIFMSALLIRWSSTWTEKTTVKKRVFFMLVASVVFGLIHYSGGLGQVVIATVMGIVFCSAYIYSKNLLACILVHGVLNYVNRGIFFMFYDEAMAMIYVERMVMLVTLSSVVVIPFAIWLTIKAETFSDDRINQMRFKPSSGLL